LALLLSAAAFYVIRTNMDNRRLLSEESHQRQIAQSLQAVAIDLNSNLDEMSLLRNILQQLALVIQYDNSGLFLAENGYLALREGIGFQDTGVSRTPLTEKQSPNARVFNEKRPIMLADARDDPEWQNWTAATAVGAWMGAPLLVNQEAIGILTVHSHTPDIYTPADLHTLQAFADQASTALKNAQLLKETHTAREIAESANRAKSAFLAAMSHELRTPLNGVLGYAQILQQDEQLTNEQRRGIEVIARSGNHLLNLINEVLDLAKIEAGRLELESAPFLLPALLEDVIAFCDIRARHKGLQFQQTLAKIPTTVRGDAKRLRQILLNVLGNAIKFTEAGQVWLEVKIISDKLPVNPPCAQLCFTVTDSGPGIPAAALGSIFEPFQQAGSLMQRSQGTGLGLAISRNLLTLMDSHLYAMSKTAGGDWTTTAPKMPPPPALAHGSRFWFYLCLPLSDADLPDDHPPTRRIIGYKGDPLKILIVDDNADNRAVLTGLLEPLGFLISEAEDGQEGLIKTLAWQPRVILTDLVMPKLDGFSFVRQLRQLPAFADTIIIAASASVLEADVQRSLDIGSNSFLPKPIQAEDLYQQLEQLLQLEWIYAGRPSPTSHPAPVNMVYPPPAMLRPLHIAALHGNITAVFHQAQTIEQANEALYHPFTDKVRRLAHEFRLDELANWLADK
ncbi:MAG: response regulator, partial [Anaerolinea sp.]|nr:response regulator [Anaerolinea sp.]